MCGLLFFMGEAQKMDSRQEEKVAGFLHSRGAALLGAVLFAGLSALLARSAAGEADPFFAAALGFYALFAALCAVLGFVVCLKAPHAGEPPEIRTVPKEDVLSAQDGAAPNEAELRCRRLFEAARADAGGESASVRLQVKVRAVEKLRKLLQKSRISEAQYALWRRRIMDL